MQPTQAMDEVLTALAGQDDELDELIGGLDESGWARPSRCPDWSISDVVLHLAQTNEMALASALGQFAEAMSELADGLAPASSVDDGADLMVARERGRTAAEIEARWRSGADELARVLRACDPRQRVVWVAGELSARTLATTRLAWRTLPYAFSRAGRTLAGPVALALTAPDGTIWEFRPDGPAATTVTGPALDFCLVAARRIPPSATALEARGPDGDAVLEPVRTLA